MDKPIWQWETLWTQLYIPFNGQNKVAKAPKEVVSTVAPTTTGLETVPIRTVVDEVVRHSIKAIEEMVDVAVEVLVAVLDVGAEAVAVLDVDVARTATETNDVTSSHHQSRTRVKSKQTPTERSGTGAQSAGTGRTHMVPPRTYQKKNYNRVRTT